MPKNPAKLRKLGPDATDEERAEASGITVDELRQQRREHEEHNKLTMKLWNKKEKLHPDLIPFVEKSGDFWFIKHPLYNNMYSAKSPDHNALINYQYLHSKNLAEERLAKKDWLGYIIAHEGPFQMEVLHGLVNHLADKEYWEMIGNIFTNMDNQWQYKDILEKLLTSDRPKRSSIMTTSERRKLSTLPDEIQVYRGYGIARFKEGWSWTTDQAKAEWFARRFAALDHVKPKVITGTVSKTDVIAYFGRRKESEIVCRPKSVKEIFKITMNSQ